MPAEQSYTPGRYVIATTDARGARDPFGLTSQVKLMRDGFERLDLKPALILLVVADGEEDAATRLVKRALDDQPRAARDTPEALDRLASAAFESDTHGGHHRGGPWTWHMIGEDGQENYRRLARDVLAELAKIESEAAGA